MWIGVAHLALRHTLLGGYMPRSCNRAAEQETWALLAVYQLLSAVMAAVEVTALMVKAAVVRLSRTAGSGLAPRWCPRAALARV